MLRKDEYVDVSSSDPIRQGDIFSLTSVAPEDPPPLGIILTADCDIAQEKMGTEYTYIPIVSATYYMRYIWPLAHLRNVHSACADEAAEQVYSLHKRFDSEVDKISRQDLVRWIMSDSDDKILGALHCSDTKASETISLLFSLVRATHPSSLPMMGTPISILLHAWQARGNKTEKAKRNELRNALLQMRIDTFFLNYVPSQGEIGFVVLLRHVRSIPRERVFATFQETRYANSPPPHGYRVGRLNDYLKYAIVHQFASVFLRIGLPQHYESDTEEIANMICDDLLAVG